ncbi:hypothetical protein HMPREF0105_0566 [Bacteroides sp. 3_1_33FAA]|nr:hypothetical protein HMPREF0105_0566 [Bacteroides sp. 3_1_33FAA]
MHDRPRKASKRERSDKTSGVPRAGERRSLRASARRKIFF